jgi:hypothetical protein
MATNEHQPTVNQLPSQSLNMFPITVEAHRAYLQSHLEKAFDPGCAIRCMLHFHLETLGYPENEVYSPASVAIMLDGEDLPSLDIPEPFITYQHRCIEAVLQKSGAPITGQEALALLDSLCPPAEQATQEQEQGA